MRFAWLQSSLMSRAGVLLILAAFLMRALVPVGYMAERDTDSGKFVVEMCDGYGSHKTIVTNIPLGDPAKKASKDTCPYAAANTSILPTLEPFAVEALQHVFAVALLENPQAPIQTAWSLSAPPTGPPALV